MNAWLTDVPQLCRRLFDKMYILDQVDDLITVSCMFLSWSCKHNFYSSSWSWALGLILFLNWSYHTFSFMKAKTNIKLSLCLYFSNIWNSYLDRESFCFSFILFWISEGFDVVRDLLKPRVDRARRSLLWKMDGYGEAWPAGTPPCYFRASLAYIQVCEAGSLLSVFIHLRL